MTRGGSRQAAGSGRRAVEQSRQRAAAAHSARDPRCRQMVKVQHHRSQVQWCTGQVRGQSAMIRGLTSTAPSLKKYSKIKQNGLSGQNFLSLRRALPYADALTGRPPIRNAQYAICRRTHRNVCLTQYAIVSEYAVFQYAAYCAFNRSARRWFSWPCMRSYITIRTSPTQEPALCAHRVPKLPVCLLP